jgi:hypothetical protein
MDDVDMDDGDIDVGYEDVLDNNKGQSELEESHPVDES